MSVIEYVSMVGAVLVISGGLVFWQLLIELKESIKSKIIEIVTPKGTPGVGSRKNRWGLSRLGMHYGENIVELGESPTTDVIDHLPIFEDDFNQEEYELPNSDNGKELPSYLEIVEQINSLKMNESGLIGILEKMATNMLARDKKIAEVEDRLRDATFILYGGKKPDED